MDIVEQLREKEPSFFMDMEQANALVLCHKAADEIERLRKVVTLLIEYEEHDENIYKGAVMWEALIEAAHRALMEKQS